MRVALLCLVGLTAVGTPVASAQAQEESASDAEFSRVVEKGLNAYKSGDYAHAIESFEKAYQLKQDPNLLFNIARSHERLGDIDEAIATYDRFVNAPGPTAQERSKALAQIEALKKEKAAREAAAQPVPSPTSSPASPAPAPMAAETTVAPKRSQTLEYALVGGGAAALLVGGIFGIVTLGHQSDFNDATTVEAKQDAKDAGQTTALVTDVALGVGIVSLATGIILLAIHDDKPGEDVALFNPVVGPNGLGIAGTF